MNVSPIFSSMKRFLLLILAVATFSGAVADEVTPSAALRIAEQVFDGYTTRNGELAVAWDSSILGTTRNSDSTPTFYVVAPECGEGFVIVAGDDVFPPVLAYSTTYSAPMEDGMPENFEAWLRYVDRVVRYAREHGLEANEATARKWSEGYTPVDAIMLNTARWSQGWPYNMYCPWIATSIVLRVVRRRPLPRLCTTIVGLWRLRVVPSRLLRQPRVLPLGRAT